jgi:hypothetical protein
MDYRDLSTRLKYAIHPAHWTFQKYTQWHKELEKAAFERSVAGILHPYATRRCFPLPSLPAMHLQSIGMFGILQSWWATIELSADPQ